MKLFVKTFSNPNDVAGTNVSGKHYLIHFADALYTVQCTAERVAHG